MNISSEFNGFLHGPLLTDFFNRVYELHFELWVDDKGGIFTFVKGENFNDMDDLKQLLKDLNLDYPVREDGEKVSTAEIDSKSLTEHIEFIFSTAAFSDVKLEVVEREWKELLNDAGIYR